MKLKAKPLKISAQGHLVCMLNSEEAKDLQIRSADRVILTKGSSTITAVVDISNTHHFLGKGQIGLMDEVVEELSIKRGDEVDVQISSEPYSVDYIRKKLVGGYLDDVATHSIVSDVGKGRLSQEEISVFITACYLHGLKISEILDMVNSLCGDIDPITITQDKSVDIRVLGDPTGIIKHAVSIVVSASGIPSIAALESSSSNPSSSSDVFKAFSASYDTINTSLSKLKLAYANQEDNNISLASRRIKYSEAPLCLYPKDIMLASMLALVKYIKSSYVYLCVFHGEGTHLPDLHSAKSLVRSFDKITHKLKVRSDSVIYDLNQIFTGNSGPSIEAKMLLSVFSDDPKFYDLRSKIVEISGNVIDMVNGCRGFRTAKEIVDSGHALDHLIRVLKYHNSKISRSKFSPRGIYIHNIKADNDSSIISFNIDNILKIAKICGAPDDILAGVEVHSKIHSVVSKNDIIATLHSKSKHRLKRAKDSLENLPLFELS